MPEQTKAKQIPAGAVNLIRYYQESVLSPAPSNVVVDHMIDMLATFVERYEIEASVASPALRRAVEVLVTQQRLGRASAVESARNAAIQAERSAADQRVAQAEYRALTAEAKAAEAARQYEMMDKAWQGTLNNMAKSERALVEQHAAAQQRVAELEQGLWDASGVIVISDGWGRYICRSCHAETTGVEADIQHAADCPMRLLDWGQPAAPVQGEAERQAEGGEGVA